MYTEEEVDCYDVPKFIDYECISGDDSFKVDWWTITELREIFGIRLTDQEKKNRIVAFNTGVGYRGWAAVYSREDILNYRLINNA
ncbi:hypothetical protein QRY07_00715 (plasmid) [Bacillus cereus]|uniref:hypothetical protein n=1 Tax=Bacillus cereus TaxID=1396 RepID=UPI002570415A|nr:hypothetical protein [Bacillus cereus]WJE17865.1 hypothetical protein QRY07_00715 [Bacillus cereus]